MANIVVIEPHKLLRLGLLKLISEASNDYHVQGADYEPLDRGQTMSQRCDLAVLSIPSFNDAHRLIQAVHRVYNPACILLLSDSPSLPAQARTLPNTVAGHIVKNAQPEIAQASVKLVLAGGTCFPLHTRSTDRRDASNINAVQANDGNFNNGTLTQSYQALANHTNGANDASIVNKLADETDDQAAPEWELLGLTRRQYEVLVLLARGYPMKTVGRYLNISVATAKAHTETLYQRLDVHNRNAAVYAAVYAAVAKGATLGWPNIASAKQALQG